MDDTSTNTTNNNIDLDVDSLHWNGSAWTHANQFLEVGNSLFENRTVLCPILMNYVFACELALKACAQRTKQGPQEGDIIPTATFESPVYSHDLAKIFDELPEDTRKTVKNEFEKLTGEDLRPQLVQFKDYFLDIRYPLNKKVRSWNLIGMKSLANDLLKATRESGKHICNF